MSGGKSKSEQMASTISDSIRVAEVADASAIAALHVGAWRETYAGLIPADVLAGLSVDRRTEMWGRILSDPEPFSASAVFVAEREGAIVGFGCCGLQRAERLNAQGYDGEISAIYLLRAFQGCGFGRALMCAMAQELQHRQLHGASLWVLRENQKACRFYDKLGGDVVADKEEIREGGFVFIELAYGRRDLRALILSATIR
jgi:ribosomal protein S18 acetylase RimI-like enzyme